MPILRIAKMAKTSVNAFRSSKYSTSTNAAEGNAVLIRRQSCVDTYAEDALHRHQLAPSGVKRRAALARRRRNSLPAGTGSHTEDQPVTSQWCSPATAVGLFPY